MRPLGTLLRVWLAVGLLLVGTAVHRCQGVDATINVTGTVAHPLSPMLYGVFFEEINFAGEGGLYAELVRNRDFEALGRGNLGDGKFEAPVFKRGDPKQRPIVTGAPPPVYTDLRPWYPVQEGEGATAVLSLDNTTHPFSTNPTTLKLVSDVGSGCSPAGQCGSGFGNPGYWGIGAVAGKNYKVSFYASTSSAKAVRYTARLVVPGSGNGNFRVIGSVDLPVFGLGWSQYSSFINPTESHSNAHLQILTAESNTAWFDSVSLFPEDAVLGLFRPELYAKLQELRPSFIRFPGGNYLEGSDLSTAWQWKRTLNQTEARPGHFNAAWGYWSTDGLGLYEYFLLCEALRAEPQMSIYTGYDLGRHYVPINQSQFIVQDAVDAVQYANGDPSFTRWGRVRSSNGHDRPFHMKRIEVGNEEYLMQDYAEHYQLITQAIWAKDPNMTVIASGRWGPSVDGSPCLTGQRCDLWDDHFYLTPDAMLQHSSWYDAYDRKLPKVFVGEYAANGNNDPGSLRAALAEAAFLMGLEQNGDAVLTSSFAPLFRNVNGSQWGYDLINFNSSALYTIPSFHVQKLFRSVLGDHVLQSAFSGLDKSVASVVLGKNNRTLVVKAVHYANFPITCDISLDPTLKPAAGTAATLTVLTSADPMDANSLNQPNKVVPVTSQITFNTVPYKLQVPAWSLFVLEVPLAA